MLKNGVADSDLHRLSDLSQSPCKVRRSHAFLWDVSQAGAQVWRLWRAVVLDYG